MCLLELLAVLLAHRHHGRHVHLVEGGEDGILVLRLKQALGNAGAQSGHRHTLLGTLAVDHLGGRGALRLGRGSVLLGDAAAATRTCHVVGSDAFLGEDLARCRAGGAFGSSRCRGCRCRCGCCGGRGCGRLLRRGRGAGGGLGFGVDLGDQLTGGDAVAALLDDLHQHTIRGRGRFQHNLVGFDIDEVFIAGNSVAFLLVPADQRGFGNGLGQLRHFNFDQHFFSLLCIGLWLLDCFRP